MTTTYANISSIFLGNVADIDVNESDSESELADTLLGTFGSTTDPLWKERVTIATEGNDDSITRDDAGGWHPHL